MTWWSFSQRKNTSRVQKNDHLPKSSRTLKKTSFRLFTIAAWKQSIWLQIKIKLNAVIKRLRGAVLTQLPTTSSSEFWMKIKDIFTVKLRTSLFVNSFNISTISKSTSAKLSIKFLNLFYYLFKKRYSYRLNLSQLVKVPILWPNVRTSTEHWIHSCPV